MREAGTEANLFPGTYYDVEVATGYLDGDPSKSQLVAAMGPFPNGRQITGWSFDGSLDRIWALDFAPPYSTNYGVHVAVGAFGF